MAVNTSISGSGASMLSGGTLTAIPGVSTSASVYSASNGNTAFGNGGWVVGSDTAAFAYNANTNTTYTFAQRRRRMGANNAGQVVGGDSGGAFIWTSAGGFSHITSAITMTTAFDISNNGKYIVGVNSANQPVLYNTVTQACNTIDLSNIQGITSDTRYGIAPGTKLAPYSLFVNNSGMVVGNTFFMVVPNVWGYDEGWFVMPGQSSAVPLGSIMPAAPAGYMQMGTEPCINDKCQISVYGVAFDSAIDCSLHSYLLSPVAGDANLDGKVDINDLTIVLTNYGQTGMSWSHGRLQRRRQGGHQRPDHRADELRSDRRRGGASRPVPEPASLVLLGVGAVALLGFAWRRCKGTV